MTVATTTYRGVTVLDGTPSGAGGLLLNNALKALAERAGPNYVGTADPTAEWDAADTAGVGTVFELWSIVRNTTSGALWLCVDSTAGAAVWVQFDGSGGGGGGTVDVVSNVEADRLPDGSSVRRVDGPGAPYPALVKRKGLWEGPNRRGGLGTAVWEILAIGPGRWER